MTVRLEKLTTKQALQLSANHTLGRVVRSLRDAADYYLVDHAGNRCLEVAPHDMDECGTFLTV